MPRALVTPATAEMAIQLALPLIDELIATGIGHRSDLHIVVLNPADGDILREYSLGDPKKWEHPYDKIARGKAKLAYKHRQNTRTLLATFPQLLEAGDVVHAGGVYLDGVVVGISGFRSHWDEAVAHTIAAIIRAYAISLLDALRAANHDFVPEPEN